jgi:hypothetical protein
MWAAILEWSMRMKAAGRRACFPEFVQRLISFEAARPV